MVTAEYRKEILARAIARLPRTVNLTYVAYDDQFTAEQIALLLAGDMESFWKSTADWEGDCQHQACVELLREAVRDEDDDTEVYDAIFDDAASWEAFREACESRNTTTWFDDLVRQTGRAMIKYDLGYDLAPGAWDWTGEQIAEAMAEIAAAAGIDLDVNKDVLRSLVVEASYGGSLHVLHHSDLADLLGRGSQPRATQAVFTDPVLLVHDRLNGSGYADAVRGSVTVTVRDDTLQLDAGRMSWSDDIAGVVHAAHQTPVTYDYTAAPANDAEEA